MTCVQCGIDFLRSQANVAAADGALVFCGLGCRNANPEFRRKVWIGNNLKLQQSKAPTRLELAGRSILVAAGVDFREQVLLVGKFTVDVLIGERLVVQWDGGYWHGYRSPTDARPRSPRQLRRMDLDRSHDAYLRKAGYVILRFWEHEVHQTPAAVAARIETAQTGEEFPE